jgi:hypothetical protein
MSAARRSVRAIRSRGLTFRSSSASSGSSSRNGVRSSTPGSPPAFVTRPALAALAVRRAWSAMRPTTMSVRRVPWARLTSWPTSGTAGVSGPAFGCGSSDTAITPLPKAGRHDVYHRQECFPPGSALHGDHLSLAVRIVLAHVPLCHGLRWWLVVSGRGRDGHDMAGRCDACAPSANGSPAPDDYPPTALPAWCSPDHWQQATGLRSPACLFKFTGTTHSVTVDVSGELIRDDEAEPRVHMARRQAIG